MPLDMSRFGQGVVEPMNSGGDNLLDIQWGTGLDFRTVEDGRTVAHFESLVSQGLPDTGRIQLPYGPEAGQGYGYDYAVVRVFQGEGGGPAVLLWPGDNRWPGYELDFLEITDEDREEGFSVHHWRGEGNSDQFNWHLTADMPDGSPLNFSDFHELGFLREPDRLSYFIDRELVWTTTENVPIAFEDGGVDLVLGAQITAAGNYAQFSDRVRLEVDEMGHLPLLPVAEGTPPIVAPGTPEAPTLSVDQIAEIITAEADRTGEWVDIIAQPIQWAPAGVPAEVIEPISPTEPVDWNAIAALVTAQFEATGRWELPPTGAPPPAVPPPAPPPPAPDPTPDPVAIDWNEVARVVQANFAATGQWVPYEDLVAPPPPPEPGPDSVPEPEPGPGPEVIDWNALAAVATANWERTGQWFV